jgi:hypothetical protein
MLSGMVGHEALNGFTYNPNRPKAGCLICGRIFQSTLDRTAVTNGEKAEADALRQLWRLVHAEGHSRAEHDELAHYKALGCFSTPEAAEKLAPFGVFSINDLVLSSEHAHALRQAKRAPENDADSETRGIVFY